ncbi:MAG: hypothetical protein IKJ27_11845 [Clostridia bacterium]|nr:hypothetical protein [Clostridia bacterium]
MKKKTVLPILMIAFILIIFYGCSSVGEYESETTEKSTATANNSPIFGSTKNQNETTLPYYEDTTDDTDILFPDTTDNSEQVLTETGEYSQEPAYGFVWALDERSIANVDKNPETIEYITYEGEPITVFCQLTSASLNPWEFGLFIEVEGVLQQLTVDETKTEIYKLELQPFETATVKMSFEPNIGKKDEILNLSCAVLLLPDYIAQEDEGYRIFNDPQASGNYPLVMNADSKTNANITDDKSLYEISSVDRRIFSNYEVSNNLECFEALPGCYVYEKLTDYLEKEGGSYIRKTKITTRSSQNSKLIINIHGKPGTYRVSFYLNGDRVKAFDGKEYLNVTIGKEQQAEIPVLIDTREMKGANRIEVYLKEIGCNFVEGDVISSSGAQKYIVK